MIPVFTGLAGGIVCGTISGLTPGIHSNMIAALLLGFSPVLLPILGPEGLAAVLIATLITHSFVEIVPATFLGVPDEGTCLSVLPAHAMTLAGKGEEAVRVSALGSLWGVITAIPIAIAALWFIPAFQPVVDLMTGVLLVLVMGLVIVRSEAPGWSFALFATSGVLGLFAFHYAYVAWNTAGAGNVLMPLLTGLFGLPLLLMSSESVIPRQRFTGISERSGAILRSAIPGSIAGLIVGWLPGLSTASANALLSGYIPYDKDRKGYLIATGASGTANAVIGIAVFIAIGRMRNGVMTVFSTFETPSVSLLITLAAVTALGAYCITLSCAGMANMISGLDSFHLNTVVAVLLVLACGIFTGPFGLIILGLATIIGMIPSILQITRIPCMGVVTIPVILYSFGLGGF